MRSAERLLRLKSEHKSLSAYPGFARIVVLLPSPHDIDSAGYTTLKLIVDQKHRRVCHQLAASKSQAAKLCRDQLLIVHLIHRSVDRNLHLQAAEVSSFFEQQAEPNNLIQQG